jgi:hypothetical protein
MQEESIHEPSSDEKRKKKKVCLWYTIMNAYSSPAALDHIGRPLF